jgi:hypothetical protein
LDMISLPQVEKLTLGEDSIGVRLGVSLLNNLMLGVS